MGVGDREKALGRMLSDLGYRASMYEIPRVPGLPAEPASWIMDLYRKLGGIQEHPKLSPRGWDHPLVGLIVELDEEQHFNRYRAQTLSAVWSRDLPWSANYLRIMDTAETVALRKNASGGFWTNANAEKLFGTSSPARQLDGGGSARWKQRALYDAMRDAAAAAGLVNLSRVSVYDTVAGRALGEVLLAPRPGDSEDLEKLIERRTCASGASVTRRVEPDRDNPKHRAETSSARVPLSQPTPTLKQLAIELGQPAAGLRRMLRQRFRRLQSQRGESWDPLAPEMVDFLRFKYRG